MAELGEADLFGCDDLQVRLIGVGGAMQQVGFIAKAQRRIVGDTRRHAEQGALVRALEDQAQLGLLEVPEAAMDELGAFRRGSRGEIGFIDEAGAQAAQRGIAGDSSAGDSASEDQQIELGTRKLFE